MGWTHVIATDPAIHPITKLEAFFFIDGYYLSIKLKIDRADVFEKLINTYVEKHIN